MDGTISLWDWFDSQVEKSTKRFGRRSLVLSKNGRIFAAAASQSKDIVELSMNLQVVKRFKNRNVTPRAIDASKDYLVIGYASSDETPNIGQVDIHSRRERDKNGIHQQRVVSFSDKYKVS